VAGSTPRRGTVVVFRDERSEEYPRHSKRAVESFRQTGLERGIELMDFVYALDPDWAELLGLYVRGGLYQRTVVPLSTRELCACAALAALDKQALLETHLRNAVEFGASKEDVLEAVLQSVTYGGFPSAIASLRTYAEIFPEMVKHGRPPIPASEGEMLSEGRYGPAVETTTHLYGEAYARTMLERYDRWDPDFSVLAQRFVHGGMYARTVVSAEMRELLAIGCLVVRNALPQLETHLRVGHRLGIGRAEMQEIILQMSAYCGYPYVVQAMASFERVAAEWDRESGPVA
jgi:4-carboxymuconolactone decarboxylase